MPRPLREVLELNCFHTFFFCVSVVNKEPYIPNPAMQNCYLEPQSAFPISVVCKEPHTSSSAVYLEPRFATITPMGQIPFFFLPPHREWNRGTVVVLQFMPGWS